MSALGAISTLCDRLPSYSITNPLDTEIIRYSEETMLLVCDENIPVSYGSFLVVVAFSKHIPKICETEGFYKALHIPVHFFYIKYCFY